MLDHLDDFLLLLLLIGYLIHLQHLCYLRTALHLNTLDKSKKSQTKLKLILISLISCFLSKNNAET